ALALTAVDLLWDGGALAREVLRSSKPRMTKEEYLKFQRAVHRREAFDGGAPSPLSFPPHPTHDPLTFILSPPRGRGQGEGGEEKR
ncbi:MAG: hypothetical protein AABZ20_04985, partial [candidate division NC10 bacterium]